MDLKDYQREQAIRGGVYPAEHNIIYPMIGLANETGEAMGKLKKYLRGDKPLVEIQPALLDELGDVLWYLTAACRALGADLEDIAQINSEKLRRRDAAGTVKGDGDRR